MKFCISVALAVSVLASSAYADSRDAYTGFGARPATSPPSVIFFNYGEVARQANDGSGLTSSPTYNSTTNNAIGSIINNTITGSGNTVDLNSTNTGNTTATQVAPGQLTIIKP